MRYYLFVYFFIGITVTSFSQGLFESSLSAETTDAAGKSDLFTGYVRGSGFGLSEEFDYSFVFSELSLGLNHSARGLVLKSDIRFRSGWFFNEKDNHIEIKEAYAGYSHKNFDVYLGNQIVMWGRTDGFNPTNNINPVDYFFLSAEPDDQIMSNFMLRLRYRINNNIDAEVIGIPFYIPSNYRYDLFDMDNFGDFAGFGNTVMPDKTFENSAFAGRLNFEYPAAGFAISYFNGYDPFIAFNYRGITWDGLTPSIELAGESYRKQAIGIDFAIPVKSWIVRGEAAYNHTKDYENNIHIPNPNISYVLGLDKRFGDFQTVFQYIGMFTRDFKRLTPPSTPTGFDPAEWLSYFENSAIYEMGIFTNKIFLQQEKTNHALMASFVKPFAYETIYTELMGLYNITSEEILMRGKVEWKATDNFSLSGGGFYMSGPENSLYSYSASILAGSFVEIKAIF